jgi:transcription antitermination factor NusG
MIYDRASFAADYGRWHAIHTAPQCERFVLGALVELGFAAHIEETRDTEIRRGKKVELVRNNFPRYVFALFRESDAWMRALDIPGVQDIISMMPADRMYRMPLCLTPAEVERMFCEAMHDGIIQYLARNGYIKPPSMRSRRKSAAQRRRLAKARAA